MNAIAMGSPPGNGEVPEAFPRPEASNQTLALRFSYPNPATVKGRVLLDCWRRFGSARLAHHVHMLRRVGWPVRMLESTVRTTDAGRSATIGEYFLDRDTTEQAGETGQRFAAEAARIERERRAA